MGDGLTVPAIWILLQGAASNASGSIGLLMILAVFAIFYFLLILPVQRRQKRQLQMQSSLKPGDRVLTSGGLRGVIVSVKDEVVQLRIPPDQVKLEFMRSSVQAVIVEEPASK